MVSGEEVDQFLTAFKVKLKIWDVLFMKRDKNLQTLLDLEISPGHRKQILEELEAIDYSQGPLPDETFNAADMWIFGKTIKGKEVYIKITLGRANLSVICISFHLAEYPMSYPLK